MRTAPEIEITLGPRNAEMSLQEWLYSEFRTSILSGSLPSGARLPATRDLARKQGVSRTTVLAVYDQLTAEGYIVGETGRGSFVSDHLPDQMPGNLPNILEDSRLGGISPGLSARGKLLARSPFSIHGRGGVPRTFRVGVPDIANFPFELWTRIAARRYRLSNRSLLVDTETLGYRPLRQAIADHIHASRGVVCSADNIAILGSVQQVIDLCARLILDPGDTAWMEDPGYSGSRYVLEAAEANIANVPVDEHGLVVSSGIEIAPNAKLAYVTVGRQFPLAVPLSLGRRLELLEWAEKANALIIEDDYDSEYRFDGAPLAALKSLDRSGRVIYVGTFSKLLFPSLRLAYMVIPDNLVDSFAAAISMSLRFTSSLPQVVLHEFMNEGHFGRHIRRMRMLYAERAEALRYAADSYWKGLLELPNIIGGLYSPAFLPDHADDIAIANLAEKSGIETMAISHFKKQQSTRPGLVLGYAPFTPDEIMQGAIALKETLGHSLDKGIKKHQSSQS
jgi:GntR family transcriptional regulator/MocR family aminotransferase